MLWLPLLSISYKTHWNWEKLCLQTQMQKKWHIIVCGPVTHTHTLFRTLLVCMSLNTACECQENYCVWSVTFWAGFLSERYVPRARHFLDSKWSTECLRLQPLNLLLCTPPLVRIPFCHDSSSRTFLSGRVSHVVQQSTSAWFSSLSDDYRVCVYVCCVKPGEGDIDLRTLTYAHVCTYMARRT